MYFPRIVKSTFILINLLVLLTPTQKLFCQIILPEDNFYLPNQTSVTLDWEDKVLDSLISFSIKKNVNLLMSSIIESYAPNNYEPDLLDISFIRTQILIGKNNKSYNLNILSIKDDLIAISTIYNYNFNQAQKTKHRLIKFQHSEQVLPTLSLVSNILIFHDTPCRIYDIDSEMWLTTNNQAYVKELFSKYNFTLSPFSLALPDGAHEKFAALMKDAYNNFFKPDMQLSLSNEVRTKHSTTLNERLRNFPEKKFSFKDIDWEFEILDQSDPFNTQYVAKIQSPEFKSNINLIKKNSSSNIRIEFSPNPELSRTYNFDSVGIVKTELLVCKNDIWANYPLSEVRYYVDDYNRLKTVRLYEGSIDEIVPIFLSDKIAISFTMSNGDIITIFNGNSRSNILPLFYGQNIYRYHDGAPIARPKTENQEGKFYDQGIARASSKPNGFPTEGTRTSSNTFKGTETSGDFQLGSRKALSRPSPLYNCEGDGVVVVKVYVDRGGVVRRVEGGQKGSTTLDACLIKGAEEAALKTRWEGDPAATELQIGTIRYGFSRQ